MSLTNLFQTKPEVIFSWLRPRYLTFVLIDGHHLILYFFCIIFLHSNFTTLSATTSAGPTTTKSTTTTEEKCGPGRSVVFLKTHKTASTTLTNIFLRYAEKNKLLVGLPPKRHWELAGYPAKFKSKLVDPAAKEYQAEFLKKCFLQFFFN